MVPPGAAGGSTSHPTPRHLADELKRDDGRLWPLLELLTRGDEPQLLHEVIRRLVDLLEADEVALYAGHAPAVLLAAHGARPVADQHHLVDLRMSDALATRNTVALLPKDHEGAWRVAPQTYIRSGLWVPSPEESMTPAIVRVLRVRPEHFPAGTRRLLEIVVQRLAAVLHRIQQQRYDQARDTERTQLFLVSASIAQELDFELVAERVVLGVTSVTDFADATVEVRHGQVLRRAAAFGNGDLSDDVTSKMALWQEALVDEHRVGELSYRVPLRDALPARPGEQNGSASSGLVTELLDRDGGVLGYLTLSRPRTGAEPTEQMVQTIELFARQAQIALVNASLYVEAKRQRDIAQALTLVTSAVSQSLETDEILEICCRAAQTHSVGERAAIYLLDEHGQVTLATSYGRDSEVPASARGPLLVADDPLLTEAVQSPQPVVVGDLADSARYSGSWLARELGLRSVAVYALRANDTTLGILMVDGHTTQVEFARSEEQLLSQIAAQAAVALRQSSLHAQTREHATRNAQLLELTTAMTTSFEFKAIFERIVQAVRSRMDGHAVSVLRIGHDIQVLGTITGDRLRCPCPPQRLPLSPKLREALELVWEEGTLRLDDVRVYPTLTQIARPETRSVVLAAPLNRRESDVLLTVSTTKVGAFTRGDERFLADLVRVTKLAVRNSDLFVEVSEAAQRDPLTGLRNRRAFWDALQGHLEHLGQGTLALAVVDADNFKRINDRLGHTVGDAALRHIADRLRRSVRETDEVFRIGGEEFTIIMPDASGRDAHSVMMRVLTGVRQSRADLPPLSVSIGVAIAPDDGLSVDELFREADHALLRAKRDGKNRITLRNDVT